MCSDEALEAGSSGARSRFELSGLSVRRSKQSIEVHRKRFEILDSGATSAFVVLARRALDPTISADSELVQDGKVGPGRATALGGGRSEDWDVRERSELEYELSGEVGSSRGG